LSRLYGQASSSFLWAAHLALGEISSAISSGGLDSLSTAPPEIDGLVLGEVRNGAGTGLVDLAKVAIRQVSSLASELPGLTEPLAIVATEPDAEKSSSDVERRVKAHVGGVRPEWRDKFGQRLLPAQQSRSIRYGFIGAAMAANFGSLTSLAPRQIAIQVDRSKARLWDLQQLQSGVLADDLFGTTTLKKRSHQLLVLSPHGSSVRSVGARGTPNESILGAEEELKSEAVRAGIECLPMSSIEDIARHLLRVEGRT
jgi:hypothetical protein